MRTEIQAMTNKEFDVFMCKTFPVFFQDRNKPMSETAMCWGFCIGTGWQYLVYDTCVKLDTIYKTSNIAPVFDQIKEKFAGLRLYYHIINIPETISAENTTAYGDLIYDIIDDAETKSYHICDSCGETIDHSTTINRWVYAKCDKCLGQIKNEKN